MFVPEWRTKLEQKEIEFGEEGGLENWRQDRASDVTLVCLLLPCPDIKRADFFFQVKINFIFFLFKSKKGFFFHKNRKKVKKLSTN